MITSAIIENFKGFKHLELPDLCGITLLGGRNNVGKTSVLEALFLFQNGAQPDFFRDYFDWRDISFFFLEPENILAPLFRNYAMEDRIAISVLRDNYKEVLELALDYSQRTIEAPQADDGFTRTEMEREVFVPYTLIVTYKSEGKKDQKSRLTIRRGRIDIRGERNSSKQRNVAFVAGTRARVEDDVKRYSQLDVIGKQNVAVELLQILEARLKSLSINMIGQTPLIHGDIGLSRKIPVAHMGEGMNRLLSIILAIITSKDGLVLIDEFENGLHYSVMAKIWETIGKAAHEFNCQIIAATHSYECLRAAYQGASDANLSDEFRYIRLDQDGEDIVAKTYSHSMLGAAIERGWEVR